MQTNEDSLKVTENEDGSFAVEWDSNDPRYQMFNGMTQEQMQQFIESALADYLQSSNNEDLVND